jgi:hypothetical protein
VSNHPSTVRGAAVDAAATLGVLVIGAWVLAMTAPLVSAVAVLLTVGLYVPVRLRASHRPGSTRVRTMSSAIT